MDDQYEEYVDWFQAFKTAKTYYYDVIDPNVRELYNALSVNDRYLCAAVRHLLNVMNKFEFPMIGILIAGSAVKRYNTERYFDIMNCFHDNYDARIQAGEEAYPSLIFIDMVKYADYADIIIRYMSKSFNFSKVQYNDTIDLSQLSEWIPNFNQGMEKDILDIIYEALRGSFEFNGEIIYTTNRDAVLSIIPLV